MRFRILKVLFVSRKYLKRWRVPFLKKQDEFPKWLTSEASREAGRSLEDTNCFDRSARASFSIHSNCQMVAILCLAISTGPTKADEPRKAAFRLGERPYLTWDGSGRRDNLEEAGFTLRSRLTQFYQGMPSGDGESDFDYGGKLDFSLRTDLSKLGAWDGLSFTIKAEYNFGESVNGRGGTASIVNTALAFPGIEGADAFDISSLYFSQSLGSSGAVLFGKINMFDLGAGRRFAGGAGIDSYWNIAFAAPPSGVVPPYLFGAILSYRTRMSVVRVFRKERGVRRSVGSGSLSV